MSIRHYVSVALAVALCGVASADAQTADTAAASKPDAADARTARSDAALPEREKATPATDLFQPHSWYKAPPPPPPRPRPVQQAPTAPPLPFKFLGRYEQEGASTVYVIVKGDRVYDVQIGATIENTYKVDAVSGGQLMFTYLPMNISQGLSLGELP